ncbi:hypothetical protein JW926_13185 [Candidatus Sumerlaeota bacterium]|nr:hypothetical protein [Candidatus Sumerlaeota bacterium]
MNFSFKIIDVRFGDFWNFPLMIAVTALWLVFLVYWNRFTISVIGKVWSKRFLFLRLLSGAILLLYLFNPTIVYLKTRTKRGRAAILFDTSQSMDRRDSAGKISRLDSVKKMIGEQSFLKNLDREAAPVCFAFNRDIEEIDPRKDFFSLKADGEATDIAGAFRHIRELKSDEGWNAAILFSDGRNTASQSPLDEIQSLDCPVYCVGVGEKTPNGGIPPDRAIIRIQTNPVALLHQKNRIRAQLKHTGFKDKPVTVSLLENGKTILEKTVSPPIEGETDLALDYTPEKKGLSLLRIVLAPDQGDAVSENDSAEFTLPVTEDKIKVLYTEGTLRWEYKFLKRSLASDPNMAPAFLIRTSADKEFTQQGEGEKISSGFPQSLEELQSFQCVILGDMPRAFMTDERMESLEKFVGEHGGGLIITGGYHIPCSGEYRNTPLEKLLPVRMVDMKNPIIPLEYAVIPEQKAGEGGFQGEEKDWENVRLSRWYPSGELKPGAQVLLKRRTKTGEEGILAARHTYGKGRVVFLSSDEFWKPAFSHGDKDSPAITERFYLEGIRFAASQPLSGDKEAPLFTPRLDQVHYNPGAKGILNVEWNKERIKNVDPTLHAELLLQGKIISNIDFRRDSPNIFTSSFTPELDGNYEIRITGEAGEEKETLVVKFIVGKPYQEIESFSLNDSLLTAIAQASKGGYYDLSHAKEIIAEIRKEKRIEQKPGEREFASQPGWMLFLIILLNLEWYLRRKKGLL